MKITLIWDSHESLIAPSSPRLAEEDLPQVEAELKPLGPGRYIHAETFQEAVEELRLLFQSQSDIIEPETVIRFICLHLPEDYLRLMCGGKEPAPTKRRGPQQRGFDALLQRQKDMEALASAARMIAANKTAAPSEVAERARMYTSRTCR